MSVGRRIKIKRLDGCVRLPSYQTDGAAGMDLYAARPVATRPWAVMRHQLLPSAVTDAGLTLEPGDRARIPVGFAVAIPDGWELQIRPRSGMAWRNGIAVANSPGTIDSDYRGQVAVLLVNHGSQPVSIQPGDRIAQAVLCPVGRARFDEVDELPATVRGSGGFGSTGKGL